MTLPQCYVEAKSMQLNMNICFYFVFIDNVKNGNVLNVKVVFEYVQIAKNERGNILNVEIVLEIVQNAKNWNKSISLYI